MPQQLIVGRDASTANEFASPSRSPLSVTRLDVGVSAHS